MEVDALLRLVLPLIFAGEPYAAAVVLVGGDDPGAAGGVFGVDHAAEAADLFGLAGPGNGNAVGLAPPEARGTVDKEAGAFAVELEGATAHSDGVNLQVGG